MTCEHCKRQGETLVDLAERLNRRVLECARLENELSSSRAYIRELEAQVRKISEELSSYKGRY